jgi:hypothetical protein
MTGAQFGDEAVLFVTNVLSLQARPTTLSERNLCSVGLAPPSDGVVPMAKTPTSSIPPERSTL